MVNSPEELDQFKARRNLFRIYAFVMGFVLLLIALKSGNFLTLSFQIVTVPVFGLFCWGWGKFQADLELAQAIYQRSRISSLNPHK
jgi:hypothetical protein